MKKYIIGLSIIALSTAGVSLLFWQGKLFSSSQQTPDVIRDISVAGQQARAVNRAVSDPITVDNREIEERLRKLEALSKSTPQTKDLVKADHGEIANEDDHQFQQEQDRRYAEQLSAYYTELENQHLHQEVDQEWASRKEDQIIRSFDALPSVDNVDLTSIECRTNSCTIDFEIQPAEDDSSQPQATVFDWLLSNTGNCEIHGEAAVTPSSPDEYTTQRVHLVNCV